MQNPEANIKKKTLKPFDQTNYHLGLVKWSDLLFVFPEKKESFNRLPS